MVDFILVVKEQVGVYEISGNMKKTKPLAKGKFKTHDELIENIIRLRNERNMSYASVARNCGISRTTVVKILKLVECGEMVA